MLRDAGKGKEARTAQEEAVSIVQDLVKIHPDRYDIVYELALGLGDLMDLYADANMTKEVRKVGFDSVKTMSNLLNKDLDIENNDAKRGRYRLAFGDLLMRWAKQTEKVFDDKPGTIDLYKKASKQLQQAIDQGVGTDEDKKLILQAEARIKALGG